MSTAAQIAKLIEEFPTDAALEAYSQQYHDLCRRENTKDFLIHLATNVKLKGSKFRGLAWRVFLGAISDDKEQWVEETNRARSNYKRLFDEFKPTGNLSENLTGDPLLSDSGVDNGGGWGQKFRDEDLMILIKQDVDRTIPEVAFFQSDKIRSLMCNVLFIHAKIDPALCYKQGMHEILAPLIFVLHCDSAATSHLASCGSLPGDIAAISSQAHLEADCYDLFARLISKCRKFFIDPEKGGLDSTSELEYYIRDVYHNQLKSLDIELYRHLERNQILPQVYGVRWLRLLFGREFPMQDVLCCWDFLLASDLDYVNSFFIAMLVEQRVSILNGDAGHVLTILMRYPPVDDISLLIESAKNIERTCRAAKTAIFTKENIERGKTQIMSSFSSIYSKLDKSLKDMVEKESPKKTQISPKSYAKLERRLEEEKELKIYCATRLDRAVSQLSNHFESATSQQNGEALVALATVKQVRDFLCGSLKLKNAVLTQTIHPATIQWLEKQATADSRPVEEAVEIRESSKN